MARLHTLDLSFNPNIASLPLGPYRSSLLTLRLDHLLCGQGEGGG